MRQLAWLSHWMLNTLFPCNMGDMHEDIAGCQYPQPELAENLVNLHLAKYGEEFLDCKAFRHIHGAMGDGITNALFHLMPT